MSTVNVDPHISEDLLTQEVGLSTAQLLFHSYPYLGWI